MTFGLLIAQARGIAIESDLHKACEELKKTSSLIGTALELLTYSQETRDDLGVALRTLDRVTAVAIRDERPCARRSLQRWP